MKRPDGFAEAFKPNGTPSQKVKSTLLIGWLSIVLIGWLFAPEFFPRPDKIFERLWFLYKERNLAGELFVTLWVLGKAMIWTVVVSLGITYSAVIPALRHPTTLVTLLRFLGMTGLTYFVFRSFGMTEDAKVFMLSFATSTWFVTSMSKVVKEIKEDKYDHARSLGWSEWHVVYEVVVLGTANLAFDTMRQTFGIGFMMVTLVEGLVRSQGGIGVMLLNDEKHFVIADILAIISILLFIALIWDSLLERIGQETFKGTASTAERK